MRVTASFALITIAAIACAPVDGDDAYVSKAPAAKVVGDPVSCIDTSRTTRQVVHDDITIDFFQGSKIYRNTLRSRCPRLGFERAITFDNYGTRLCTPQIIYVLDTTGGTLSRGPGCSLGEFVPIEYIEEDE